jgi:Zn finger protein HypA/HybF involved in hydrogenase expression
MRSIYKKMLKKEFDSIKNNNFNLSDLSYGSHRKVWWICNKGHSYLASVANRNHGKGCPICANRKVLAGYNDLNTVNPFLAKEWSQRNQISSKQVTANSGKKVYWVCKNGHEWLAVIANRNKGKGCPYCKNKLVSNTNNFKFMYPNLSKQWDTSKNALGPELFTSGSSKKVWWICDYGHSYDSSIVNRVKGRGCPKCASESKTSFPEQSIYYYIKKLFPQSKNRFLIKKKEIDIYIPDIKVGIEYDGIYYHSSQDSKKKEILKDNFFKKKGIRVIRVKESSINKVLLNTIKFDYRNRKDFEEAIKILIIKISKKIIDVNIDRDYDSILGQFKTQIKVNKLTNAKLINEWNYEKNKNLKPEFFDKNSNKKVWWKCHFGHEWLSTVANRSHGLKCPVCSNQKVLTGFNDFATTNLELLSEWDYNKNKENPRNIIGNKDIKVWWRCEKGHTFDATIYKRKNGQKCPYCSGRKVISGVNDLTLTNPSLALEWNYDRNKENPNEFKAGSNKKVWWKCNHCKHEFQAVINNRHRQNSKCPNCKK